jgi:hypothetical protein
MRDRLRRLGLNGLVFGHDPDALGARRAIAMKEGWLMKLDVGLKSGGTVGMLLRCEVADIVRSDELVMVHGTSPSCGVQGPKGAQGLAVVK